MQTYTHTHTQLSQVHPKLSTLQSAINRSFKKKHSQPSTALPYFDITTCRRAQNQAQSDRRNAEGDAGRKRERLRQAAARAARRYPVTPAGLTCCDESSLQPTYMHTHTHTHTHARTAGTSTSSPSVFHLRPLSPCRAAADAIAREAQRQQRLAARREATRHRAAARRQLRREHQAATAGALQQQVDEYLASIDPEKPLNQDGWAMG